MGSVNIKDFIGNKDLPLVEAMRLIDKNTAGLLYAVDQDNRLVGCLSDGDVRRWVIKHGSIEGTVSAAMNHKPQFIHRDELSSAHDIMHRDKIYSLAVVNDSNQIIDIVFDEAILQTMTISGSGSIEGTPVVIMAGGKGTRLYPYTKILPKPLIPIGEIPIVERILNRFCRYGVKEYWLSVNYKKEMIKSYFQELSPAYAIHYVEEDKPLGTAGSLRLLEHAFDRPLIVANCDSLIDANYCDMLDFHISHKNDLTVVSSLKNISIPYGVLHSEEEGLITAMEEKPQLSCFINTGMYILNPEHVGRIPKDQMFHMTQLADLLIREGKRVGMYPVSENSFLDMGEFEEMKKMEERINMTQMW